MQEAVAHCRSVLGERQAQLQSHEADRPALDRVAAEESLAQSMAKLNQLTETIAEIAATLKADDARREQLAALSGDIERQEARAALWESMNELIGSANGKKFRVYAQSLTLEALLAFANEHLRDLARRYRLQRVPRSDLELQVVDRDMGDEVRSVYSLSGGESFLVSLALALGLASLSSRSTQVESLFIDEGFGTLDQETLDVAIASLDTLQSLGRKVGVISHVPTLVERIGTQVRVSPRSGGRSVVEVLGA
jgi:exonuclease SbcC